MSGGHPGDGLCPCCRKLRERRDEWSGRAGGTPIALWRL